MKILNLLSILNDLYVGSGIGKKKLGNSSLCEINPCVVAVKIPHFEGVEKLVTGNFGIIQLELSEHILDLMFRYIE